MSRRNFLKAGAFVGLMAGSIGGMIKLHDIFTNKVEVFDNLLTFEINVQKDSSWELIQELYLSHFGSVDLAKFNKVTELPPKLKIPIAWLKPFLKKVIEEDRYKYVEDIPSSSRLFDVVEKYCGKDNMIYCRHIILAINDLNGKSPKLARGQQLLIPFSCLLERYRTGEGLELEEVKEPEGLEGGFAYSGITFQSPLGGLKKPKVHKCKSSPQNLVNGQTISASICPFDNFGKNKRSNGSKKGNNVDHRALDLWGPEGTKLYPIFPGTVLFSGQNDKHKVIGNMIIIVSKDQKNILQYIHLGESGLVPVDSEVGYEDSIATIGVTGNASISYPHVHVNLFRKEKGFSNGAIKKLSKGKKPFGLDNFRVDPEILIWGEREFS